MVKEKNVKRNPGEKYKCQICARKVSKKAMLMHIKAEEYIINLIKKDHPQWQNDSRACDVCIAYYKKLIKDAEI